MCSVHDNACSNSVNQIHFVSCEVVISPRPCPQDNCLHGRNAIVSKTNWINEFIGVDEFPNRVT